MEKAIVETILTKNTKEGKKYLSIKFKDNSGWYSIFDEPLIMQLEHEGLGSGSEVEFEAVAKQVGGKTYYNITALNILSKASSPFKTADQPPLNLDDTTELLKQTDLKAYESVLLIAVPIFGKEDLSSLDVKKAIFEATVTRSHCQFIYHTRR